MACQAHQSKSGTSYFGQAMKVHDAEDFKADTTKEMSGLSNENVHVIIPLEENPKDRKLIRFIWRFKRIRSPL